MLANKTKVFVLSKYLL